MHSIVLFLTVLTACASSQTVQLYPLPPQVENVQRHVVKVYIGATCETLDQATASGKGFFVGKHTLVTVDHIMEAARRTFPDFALISQDGTCQGALYAGRQQAIDLLFLIVRGNRSSWVTLANETPAINERFYAKRRKGKRLPFKNQRLNEKKNTVMFSGSPMLKLGDSGTPAFNSQGEVVGMFQARVLNKKSKQHTADAYLSAFVIKAYLKYCVICEEDGSD